MPAVGWHKLRTRRSRAASCATGRGMVNIYTDNNLYVAGDPITATASGESGGQALKAGGFVPHPDKTDTVARTERT